MTNAEQIANEAERFNKLIKHWCPANLLYEGMPNTLMRAFMHATACCADQKRKLDGLDPIRPLDSYPDPMQGFRFENAPTGFAGTAITTTVHPLSNVSVTITVPPEIIEYVVYSIMENFPEASQGCVMRCTGWHYGEQTSGDWKFTFEEEDNGKLYEMDKAKLLAAFPLMFTDKWPKGCTRPPGSDNKEVWEEWLCQSDAQDYDAFIQLTCLGDVIYG